MNEIIFTFEFLGELQFENVTISPRYYQ